MQAPQTMQIDIVNPKVITILQDLAELDLIKIRPFEPKQNTDNKISENELYAIIDMLIADDGSPVTEAKEEIPIKIKDNPPLSDKVNDKEVMIDMEETSPSIDKARDKEVVNEMEDNLPSSDKTYTDYAKLKERRNVKYSVYFSFV